MDLIYLHKKAGEEVARFIAGIPHELWDQESINPGWTLRDLVNHIVSENLWVPDLIEGKSIKEVGSKYDGDVLGKYPLQSFEDSQGKADEAIFQKGALDKIAHLSYGDVPSSTYISHRLTDLVIHGWDIAKSTGQEDSLDPQLIEAVYKIVEPEKDQLTQSGYFGTPQPVSEDVGLQTKLLAMLGRKR